MKFEPFPFRDEGDGEALGSAGEALITALTILYLFTAIELAAAVKCGSIALFANGIGHFEEAAVTQLLFLALSWQPKPHRLLALGFLAILLVFMDFWIIEIWWRVAAPNPPSPSWMKGIGTGAIAADALIALILSSMRHSWESVPAAMKRMLWPRTIIALMIILAGFTNSPWPDLIIGLGIASCHLRIARTIQSAAVAQCIRLSDRYVLFSPPRPNMRRWQLSPLYASYVLRGGKKSNSGNEPKHD